MPIPQLEKKKQPAAEKKAGGKPSARKPLSKKDILRKKPAKNAKRRKIFKIIGIAAVICFLIAVIFIVAIFAWFSKDLPDPDKINERSVAQSTRIYDRTGEILLYEIHGETNRTLVKLEDIPQYCRDATITIEDANFYEHPGFDLKGILRAALAHLFNSDVKGGGSTITQQFVKNSILTNEYSYIRKIKEVILAYQIERKFSKNQILQLYLNEIPYGSTAYGIESASQNFFGKSVSALNLGECAMLAALPQSPSYYMNNKDILYGRQEYIIERMHELEYITENEMEAGLAQKVEINKRVTNIKAPHFVFYIKEALSEKYGQKQVEQGGLKVITTIDIFKQEKAEETVAEYAETNLTRYGAENAALVSIDTKTGQILAMVGSKDYFDETIDGQVNVTTRPRQPGSSFKPFVYLTAFDIGYTPNTMLFDVETDFGGTPNYHPRNYDWGERGPISMTKALAGSLNIPAVKTLYLVGVDKAVETAEKFGYTTFTNKDNYGLALVLGGAEVTLLEHTSAFATLSREGVRNPTTGILRVEDSKGRILEEWKDRSEEIFNKEAVQQINYILSTDYLRSYVFGSGSNLTLSDRPVAAKTGTTNDFRDGWTIGYTPSIATGVWAGNNDNSEMASGAAGLNVASPLWNSYMEKILAGTPVETFNAPPASSGSKGVLNGEIDEEITKKVDKFTNEIIPDECLESYPAEYVIDKTFKETHNILHYVIKDDPNGPYPANPQDEPQYNSWEKAVKLWAEGQPDYLTNETPVADCGQRDPGSEPNVSIKTPSDDSNYNNANFDIVVNIKASEGREIRKVEYIIDSILVDTQTEGPFKTDYNPTNLTDGQHSLRVIAYDDKNNNGETIVSFSFSNTTIGSYQFTKPDPGSSYRESKLPFDIQFYIEKIESISKLEFYYYNQEDTSDQSLVYSVQDVTSNSYTFSSPSELEVGDYTLYTKITTIDGGSTTSGLLSFTITE